MSFRVTNEDDGQISRDLPGLTSEDYNAEQKRKMTRRQSSKALVDSLDLESKGRVNTSRRCWYHVTGGR